MAREVGRLTCDQSAQEHSETVNSLRAVLSALLPYGWTVVSESTISVVRHLTSENSVILNLSSG